MVADLSAVRAPGMVHGNTGHPRRSARACLVLAALAAMSPTASMAQASAAWHVPEAAVRYRLTLAKKPSHASAGYLAHLPDGGIFRGAVVSPVVTTDDGKPLQSALLWWNAESGFSLVFADPGAAARSVFVYARTDRPPQIWKPDSGLTPSAILTTHPGPDSLAAAQALGRLGRVDPVVHSVNKAGIPRAPLSIGGDETGRPRPGVFYLLSHVEVTEPGKYWIAPFTLDGATEVAIDGSKITPKEHSKAWGGTGANVDLKAGLHRVEVFQTAPGTGPYDSTRKGGGLMFLTWRAPAERFKEVEARVIRESEIVRSGACNLDAVESHDGAPVAAARVEPGLTYWFENEDPLIIFKLDALASNAADTTFTWTFPKGGAVDGSSVEWLFPGFREARVKLTAKNAKGVSQATVPFFGFSTQQTSLEKPQHREAFRSVIGRMLDAYPHTPDPVANWSEAYWNNLLRTVEQGEGFEVLSRLFTDRAETMKKKLAPAQINALQDLLLDIVQRDNPTGAQQWIEKFAAATGDFNRRNDLKLRHAELLMFYLGDRKSAAPILNSLAAIAGPIGDRAKVRLGDLAFLEGDLNKATSIYADLQNRARIQRNAPLPGGLVANQLVEGGPAQPAVPDWRRSPLALQGGQKPVSAARTGPLQEVALSENVRTLTDDGYLLEARQALQEWEREFPLSKISGDFILRESALSMKSRDWKRARPMLEAYCREIDASSFLPDAASMLIKCVTQAKEPRDAIRGIIEKVKGRLKYHPVAGELDAFLAGK